MIVKFILACCMVASAVSIPQSLHAQGTEVAPGVLQVGTIQNPDIAESSGLIPSRRGKGVFWTHNDSGPDVLYALQADGTAVSEFPIKDADIEDLEDIAGTPGRLYLADIGNNDRNRSTVSVYAINEPKPTTPREIPVVRQWTLNYPDEPFDAESLLILRGNGYIIAKELSGGEVSVYRFPLGRKGNVTLQEQCRLNVDAPVSGADLTTDGRRMAVITREGAYLFQLSRGIPARGQLEPALFVPFAKEQMEGCAFTRDGLLVTAESGEIYLFTDPLFRTRAR